MQFKIEKKGPGLARVGKIVTPHGVIETPAFVVVGTKATVKALTPEQVKSLGAQIVLGNTYHLYLQPGDELIKKAGGLGKFMGWQYPTMTDSGGFQVFSLGAAFGNKVSKVGLRGESDNFRFFTHGEAAGSPPERLGSFSRAGDADKNFSISPSLVPPAKIDDDGVTFRSHTDGSEHRFTPERSIQIQHNIGADIIFAFDECTSPLASYEYQKEALDRTHRWAERSLGEHRRLAKPEKFSPLHPQAGSPPERLESFSRAGDADKNFSISPALFGIVQGGRFQDLREQSARFIAGLDFDGFGIGGSFEKEDLDTAVGWVNQILPEDKPRHLLGIGEPEDLFAGVENGVDTFDCVTPTRLGRTGTLMTRFGRLNILNAQYREDFSAVDSDCGCYCCQNYSRAYLAHLFRAKEMFAATLASIHNLYFSVNLVKQIRAALLDNSLPVFKTQFFLTYNCG